MSDKQAILKYWIFTKLSFKKRGEKILIAGSIKIAEIMYLN